MHCSVCSSFIYSEGVCYKYTRYTCLNTDADVSSCTPYTKHSQLVLAKYKCTPRVQSLSNGTYLYIDSTCKENRNNKNTVCFFNISMADACNESAVCLKTMDGTSITSSDKLLPYFSEERVIGEPVIPGNGTLVNPNFVAIFWKTTRASQIKLSVQCDKSECNKPLL